MEKQHLFKFRTRPYQNQAVCKMWICNKDENRFGWKEKLREFANTPKEWHYFVVGIAIGYILNDIFRWLLA